MCFCYHTANRRSVSTSGSALLSEDFAVDLRAAAATIKEKRKGESAMDVTRIRRSSCTCI